MSQRATAIHSLAETQLESIQAALRIIQSVEIDYTNWKGVRAKRLIVPIRIYWGATEYHKEMQHLLVALDLEKQAERTFAMKDIHSWNKPPLLPEAE